MSRQPDPDSAIAGFIARWSKAESSERANCQPFLSELCDILGVPRPDPAGPDTEQNAYVFERSVPLHHRGSSKTTTGRIDLYKRGCFVLEAKQYAAPKTETATLALAIDDDGVTAKKNKIARGTEAWDDALLAALGQAERYARNLPGSEPTPPFLVVVDVGHVFELYADFSQQGKAYLPFPDARTHRIRLTDLAKPNARERLKAIWEDPHSLDPGKISAEVTRDVARHLAELAKSFEKKHDPAQVAAFLSRCLFCMFAEDVDLLPRDSFTTLLESVKDDPKAAMPLLSGLFKEMNAGGYSLALRKTLLHFNGGLFSDAEVLPLDGTQLGLLIAASKKDWKHVEPAIFGTLLERALDPAERHKLGAHYTPRSYVERLVLPTVVLPLRAEWNHVRAAAVTLATRGDLKGAVKETKAFHHRLCAVRVLDPACGSGNFLYVTLEHLKRLEGEVFSLIESFGENMRLDLGGETVDPHQFLGLEINPRAASIAELVLWIGYLQWHHRNRGATEWPEPVLRAFKNIECRDAVLAYDKRELARDTAGRARYVWDRRTTKIDSVTGREIPDEKAVVPLETLVNPRPASWPQADFIVGNPPFLGDKVMRQSLGEGYVEALRSVYPAIPRSVDFVMYWWHKAALRTIDGTAAGFGLITTNSIKQTFNRRVLREAFDKGVSLRFAIPDHPWVDTTDGAAVRIAMTVGSLTRTHRTGELLVVKEEQPQDDGSSEVIFQSTIGEINVDLSVGANVAGAAQLKAAEGLSVNGMMLAGRGFVVTSEEARKLGLGKVNGLEAHIRPIWSGRDLTERPRGLMVLDFFGLKADELRAKFGAAYQHLLLTVKPERDANGRKRLKDEWWLFGEPRKTFRAATRHLRRYIVTVETAQHRTFVFVGADVVPEHKLVAIALEDAFHLGVLSSHIHVAYSYAAGSTLEDRPVYPASRCFQTFPFPDCTEKQKERIRRVAEELDLHRKKALKLFGLGMTDLYNMLGKVGSGVALSEKEKLLYEQALLALVGTLHAELDTLVAEAYGWHWPMTNGEILERVVALNQSRAAEEAKGLVRWLRPEYQQPLYSDGIQVDLGLTEEPQGKVQPKAKGRALKTAKAPWPSVLAERVRAVANALAAEEKPATATDLAARFFRAKPKDVEEILQTLVTLGRARPGDAKDTYVR